MINSKSKILITGGAGFIGTHLCKYLLDLDAQIIVLDNLSKGSKENLKSVVSSIKFVQEDMSEFLRPQKFDLSDLDYIFHLAGNAYVPLSVENPMYDFNQNIFNSILLLEALRKTKNPPRILHTSTASLYGNPVSMPIKEQDLTNPISPYGVSKLAVDKYIAVYSKLYKIPALNMRIFSVYGPLLRKQVIFDLLKKIKENPLEIEVYGDGKQIRDFIYIRDLVKAMVILAEKADACGESYNVASGASCSINDIIHNICDIRGVKPVIKYTGSIRLGEAEKWYVDITKLKELGFNADVSLKEGLVETNEWFESEQ